MEDAINNKSRKKDIDSIDSKMINFLQKDGRLSNTDMAKNLGISEATVRSRLKRLIDEEFIQIVAVSNPFKLGFEIAGESDGTGRLLSRQGIADETVLAQLPEIGVSHSGHARYSSQLFSPDIDETDFIDFWTCVHESMQQYIDALILIPAPGGQHRGKDINLDKNGQEEQKQKKKWQKKQEQPPGPDNITLLRIPQPGKN